ncbi:MAG: ABC transporter permease subunit, partial [Actinomycetota bacterium]|nr:ABC transporter permease subunit [Actinomycetota bacterium]
MSLVRNDDGPGILDDAVLDEFNIPFGSWIEEAVNWITLNMGGALDVIAWPFEFLLENLVDRFLIAIPWLVVVAIMFVIAWLVRNLTVAMGSAAGLIICGLLGNEFWVQTARTIGFILVAVIVCIIIGIPLGVLSGRVDSVWQVMRPTLDAMQVIHSFVYLLPFVYFWGVGRVSATMATMVFALPPLIRLTNLGIRQVPEDVVEASRAYGARELRVLRDVQLPLARPAIMTGINQTLLLAFSMLGIAAILGAGGMGALLFRALGQQDVNLAASAGLGFFLLAVILDRISQTQTGGAGLFSRMSTAWRARREPELLLENPDFNPSLSSTQSEEEMTEGQVAPVDSQERLLAGLLGIGALISLASLAFAWASNGSLFTGYSRLADAGLNGSSFGAFDAEGGSWFAYIVLLGAVMQIATVLLVLSGRRRARMFNPDIAVVMSIAMVITVLGYLVANPSAASPDYSAGLGVFVALVGGLVSTVAGVVWIRSAPYGPRRPLRQRIGASQIVVASFAIGIAAVSMVSMWQLDERGGVVLTPALQAEIEEVKRKAEAGEMDVGVAATEIQVIRAKAQAVERIVITGQDPKGVQLGPWVFGAVIVAGVGAVGASGAAGFSNRRRWMSGVVAMGFGAGVVGLSLGFVGTLARATDNNYYSGVGAML